MVEPHAFSVRGDDGEEYGPVELDELREWVRENRAGLGTQVRLDAPGELWQSWQYYPELVALLAEVRVTGGEGTGVVVQAPFARRILAGIADLALAHILVVPLIFVSIFLLPVDAATQLILQSLPPQNSPPVLPIWLETLDSSIHFGILLFYYIGFHALHGRTPAKAMMRLQVVDQFGQKPSPSRIMLREIAFLISVFLLMGIPLFYIFFNPQRRALHDVIAGTYVVEL